MGENTSKSAEDRDGMNRQIALLIEPIPEPVAASTLRSHKKQWAWSNVHDVHSPKGWWKANIGSDHGPPEDDDKPVRWRSAFDFADDLDHAMYLVEELHRRGCRVVLRFLHDGYVCDIAQGNDIISAQKGADMDEGMPMAICRAVLDLPARGYTI